MSELPGLQNDGQIEAMRMKAKAVEESVAMRNQLPEYATRGLTQQQLETQQVLADKLPCVAGFVWLKQKVGWRCAGGSHWLTDEQADRIGRGEDHWVVGFQQGLGPPGNMSNIAHMRINPHALAAADVPTRQFGGSAGPLGRTYRM
ncbi:hypothetical protein N0V90_011563 [Kalmusia sp. IMI 367209]|nr:hypothetical protein N0V90_011563 [Kalmusia sp. IMI 367209]